MLPSLATRGSEVGTSQHRSNNIYASFIDAQTCNHRESIIDNQSPVVNLELYIKNINRSGFKTSDHVQRQGARMIESAACTLICEHF